VCSRIQLRLVRRSVETLPCFILRNIVTRRITSFAWSFRNEGNLLTNWIIEQLNNWLSFSPLLPLSSHLSLSLSRPFLCFRRSKEDCENEEPRRHPDASYVNNLLILTEKLKINEKISVDVLINLSKTMIYWYFFFILYFVSIILCQCISDLIQNLTKKKSRETWLY